MEPSFNKFKSKIDKIFKKFPALGKLLCSLFGFFEVSILEFLRRISKKFKKFTIGWLGRNVLKGRWGGKVIPLNKNIPVETKFLPTQEILEIINRSNITGLSWCYCRSVQRKYNTPNCDHPLYTCIHLSFGKESLYQAIKVMPLSYISILIYSLSVGKTYLVFGVYYGTIISFLISKVYIFSMLAFPRVVLRLKSRKLTNTN